MEQHLFDKKFSTKWRVEFLIVVDIKEGVHSEMKTFERLENCPRIQPITLIFLWKLFVLHLLSMWEGESFVWELGDFSNLVPPCGGCNMGSTNIPLNFVVKICHLTTLKIVVTPRARMEMILGKTPAISNGHQHQHPRNVDPYKQYPILYLNIVQIPEPPHPP